MAFKVSQTKLYWASSKKTWEVMYQLKKKKKHNLSNSRNARHTILTLQNFDVFLPVDSFSTIAKKMKYEALTICIYLQARP